MKANHEICSNAFLSTTCIYLIFVFLNMLKSKPENNIKHIPYLVNAQQYQYSGERVHIPFGRNDFYKIWLIESKSRLHFSGKSVEVNQPALFFTHPLVSYAYEGLNTERTGYWCVFQRAFLNTIDFTENIKVSPIFTPENVDVFFPDEEQLLTIKNLYVQLINQFDTEYSFKYDMVRSYIHLLICEGVKIQSASEHSHYFNAATRITNRFFDELEKEFPIQSPEQPLKIRKPSDFAERLSVHVNHLNHAVKEVTGKSTSEQIIERVMTEAKALLKHTNWDIAEIAYSLGFEYSNHFNTYFKKHSGITPATYRNL